MARIKEAMEPSGNGNTNDINQLERLHLSRLSNYSENETNSTTQINDLNSIAENDEVTHFPISLSESSLSTAADSVVHSVLHKIASETKSNPRDNQRVISPFPSSGNVAQKNAVAPTQQYELEYDISSSSTEESTNTSEAEKNENTDTEAPEKRKSAPVESVENNTGSQRSLVRTSVSLDRVEEILKQTTEVLSTSSSDDEKEEDEQDKKPKSATSLRSRPRSASVSRLDERFDSREFVDLPNGKPLTERRQISTRNSEAELTNMFGPGHELSIFVGTWNLNLSTNVDPDSLRKFLIEKNQTKCDIYVFGSQEIPVESVIEWEIMIQRCLGRKYILLHAVRFGTLHLTLYIKSYIQSYCSAVDWGVLSVRAISTIKTKGVAACTVQIFGTKFIFLTSHLTAGEGEKNLTNRILNYRTICEKLRLRRSKSLAARIENKLLSKKYNFNVEEFDAVFWFGDLNFRIDPDTGQDQLGECMNRKLCFDGFSEQKITFMPTYKFNPNSRIYDTSRSLRQPSFTDRILFKSRVPLRAIFYDSFNELTHSDHRPVSAIFKVQLMPIKPCNTPLCMNNGEFVVSVYKAAFKEQTPQKSSSRVCHIL